MKNCLKRFMLLTLCSCVLIWVITGCNISSNSESKNKEARNANMSKKNLNYLLR